MKKLFFLSLCLLCLPFSASSKKSAPLLELRPSAKAWLVLDRSSGTHIRYNAESSRRPIASTTKLLTALAVIKKGHLETWVKVSSKAASQVPSKIGLRTGEKFCRKDLLKALLMKSANDAATALAESHSGSEAAFCRSLDVLAKSLGCRNTHILRASGLPSSGQYSTAEDLAIITKNVFKSSTLTQILGWKTSSIKSSKGRRLSLKSNNRFLTKSSAKVKGKTGYTRRAQRCFSGTIEMNSKKYTVVFLGSKNLWNDLATLRNYTINFDSARTQNQSKLSSTEIKKWQKHLAKKGWKPGTADGVWGVKTQNAFLKFQDKHKLYRDGMVGPASRKCLN
jgi:D-alanyl-D-alanine carboxypeptidase (penicillin-binding protein 5/6)